MHEHTATSKKERVVGESCKLVHPERQSRTPGHVKKSPLHTNADCVSYGSFVKWRQTSWPHVSYDTGSVFTCIIKINIFIAKRDDNYLNSLSLFTLNVHSYLFLKRFPSLLSNIKL